VGFSFLDKIATTWAPQGETPLLLRNSQRRVLSSVIALTTDAKLLKRHFDHAITGADVLVALRHIRSHLPGPLILIWDRLTAHRDRRFNSGLRPIRSCTSNGYRLTHQTSIRKKAAIKT